jgi:hypothetical protein
MRKILVTPAGRKRYLEILLSNLKKVRNEFDEWILWVNTNDESDIDYMEQIEIKNDFIKLQRSKIPVNGNLSIYQFFKECVDENSVYIRLDDDIVYIEPDSINKIFEFRINNPQYFLIYGNIVNNAITSHLYQNKGILNNDIIFGYNCLDENGWNNPKASELIHNKFFELYDNNKTNEFLIDNHIINNYQRCSINVISWLGEEFKKFNGNVGHDEEQWLSCDKPKHIKMPNIIFGDSLFVHYAFFTQRPYLDNTNILERYKNLSIK